MYTEEMILHTLSEVTYCMYMIDVIEATHYIQEYDLRQSDNTLPM